jgi:peptidoglycan/xylan/chitin deacetylase (PgdA/CDA1 family)
LIIFGKDRSEADIEIAMLPSTEPGFDDLLRELDAFANAGRQVRFWWRDDDAAQPTPALARLLDLSDAFAIEVSVAVVPASASKSLTSSFAAHRNVAVLQHGYAHRNHAAPGEPSVECGGARPVETVLEELDAGRRRLSDVLDGRAEAILAAPWNRIAVPVLDRLQEAGFRGASAYGPRRAMQGAHRLAIANVHVDPINWRERRFAGREKAISSFVGELRARRTGTNERDEPVGLLTHHLDHDESLWDFLRGLFGVTAAHPAARWIGVAEMFAEPAARSAHPSAVA